LIWSLPASFRYHRNFAWNNTILVICSLFYSIICYFCIYWSDLFVKQKILLLENLNFLKIYGISCLISNCFWSISRLKCFSLSTQSGHIFLLLGLSHLFLFISLSLMGCCSTAFTNAIDPRERFSMLRISPVHWL